MSNPTFGLKPLLAIFVVFVVSPVFFAADANAELLIDDYSAGSTIARFTAGTSSQFTVSGSILGGQRNDSLTVRDLGGQEFFGIMAFGGNLQLAQGAQDRVTGSMLYNGFADIDLTEGHRNYAFRLELAAVDTTSPIANVFSITVNDGTTTSTVGFDIPGSDEAPTDFDIRFDQFAGIDFTSIDSIELAFDFLGAPGHDLSFGSFRAIPEPGQAALLLVAFSGWMARRRRS